MILALVDSLHGVRSFVTHDFTSRNHRLLVSARLSSVASHKRRSFLPSETRRRHVFCPRPFSLWLSLVLVKEFCISSNMGKDRPTFDVSTADRRGAFKFFIANFRDFCVMEDYVNPAKELDSDDYWITAKRPKAMAALRRAFPQAEWDVLTTTIDAQISEDDKQNPAQWIAKLSQHYLGGEPIMQCTHNFLRVLKQAPGMSIQAWHTLVRLEYQKCNFPPAAADRLQRDIFVIGLNDAFRRFRGDIISHEDLTSLTLAQVISKARDFEASIQTDSAITQQHLEEGAHKVTPTGIKAKPPSRPPRRPTGPPPESGRSSCLWCGRAAHSSRRQCPASNDTCHGCGKRGHWQQVCRASSAHVVTDVKPEHDFTDEPAYFITQNVYQVSSSPKGIFVDLDFSPSAAKPASPKPLRFQVDSGCSCNTIHVSDLNNLPPVQVKPSPVRLLDYSKSVIPTTGQATLHCTRRGKPFQITVQIISAQRYYPPLLGLTDSTRMGIINYDVDTANQLEGTHTAPPPLGELSLTYIKQAYPELFEGLGKLSDPFSITLNPDVAPVQAPPHRYAAPKLPVIKEALDKLIHTGQLVRVNQPTPWISNMVVRERPATANKPAKVRICLDPSQTVNKAIIRPVYPIPTLEENIHRFHQAKIFSVFDIKDAFQTIELTLESSLLTTMHTPWGRYRWTRLPFGISSAPEEFQRRLHDVLSGIDGVVNIADDIIVIGRGESLADATKDHDRTVFNLLARLSENNLKLNPDKIQFKTSTAPFMGHVLTPEGLKPSTEIVTAILEMPQPQDKAATRRFLGTITYLAKFCPNLSEVVRPLRDLTHIKQEFLWSEQHSNAFAKAKELVSKTPCLRYFDINSPVVLQVDASEYGLGAALLQPATDPNGSSNVQWQPVAYSSSSLSPTEQRYAQIEKETLAIVHAFHKFDQLLFGKSDITVHSDHQPLETIFKRPLASAPRRLQSMILALQRYNFRVEYRKGTTLHIADTLSRAPLPSTSHKQVHDELVYRVEFESSTPDLSSFQDATLRDIRAAASSDPEQIALHSLVLSGWPNDKSATPELARPYWPVRHELTAHDGLLFKQDRVIVPHSLRDSLLRKLHAAHRGSEFTLRHARNCVFWPGLNSQITDMCQSCTTCARHAHQHPREPLQSYPVPTLPWQLVSQDLFELKGTAYLITVDHYSDFYEIDRLPSIQSSAVIQATKQHFSRHGIPHTLITDNGAQFTSDLFKSFARKYQFNHITSSPYWSQSNGRAEAAVKSAKHILLTADDVDLALLSVRNTAPAGNTFSPAQRLFGRTLRSDLPQPLAALEPFTPPRDTVVTDHIQRKLKQKKAYDKHACAPLPDLPSGSYVYAKPPPASSTKAWIQGKVIGAAGPRSYLIDTGASQIRRNRVQVQLAPSPNTQDTPSHNWTAPLLPDKLVPNPLTARPPSSHASQGTFTSLSPSQASSPSTPTLAPTIGPATTSADVSHPTVSLTASSSVSSLPTAQQPPSIPSSPRLPEPQTITRSGRVVRRPARYSD